MTGVSGLVFLTDYRASLRMSPRQYKVGPTELVDLSGVSAAKLIQDSASFEDGRTFLG